MPSVGLAFNIVGVDPGFWVLRAYCFVAGKIQHGNIGGPHGNVGTFVETPFWSSIEMSLWDPSAAGGAGAYVGGTKKPNAWGYCFWDGALYGTFSDLAKKKYQLAMKVTVGQIAKSLAREVWLGLYDIDYTEADANITLLNKYINKCWKYFDAGRNWYDAPCPYTWWHGDDIHEFIADLPNHIGLATEPEWAIQAPSMNIRAAALGIKSLTEGTSWWSTLSAGQKALLLLGGLGAGVGIIAAVGRKK